MTPMQQSFTVSGPVTAQRSFDTALRTEVSTTAGEGFQVSILDSSGHVVQTQNIYPNSYAWAHDSLSVTLASSGTYTLKFTELGPNDSLGAIIDNVKLLVCFVAGTLIDTPDGPRTVEALRPGDLVCTLDGGPQPVRWIGQRTLSPRDLRAKSRHRAIVFEPGALGPNLPRRRLSVSPQHRILRTGWKCELYFGTHEVLVPAHRLVNGSSIYMGEAGNSVTYVHFMFDAHHVVWAEGVAAESFLPTALSVQGVDAAARAELLELFPALSSASGNGFEPARTIVSGPEAALAA